MFFYLFATRQHKIGLTYYLTLRVTLKSEKCCQRLVTGTAADE